MKDQSPEPGRHRTLAEAQELLMARRAALRLAREGTNLTPPSCDPNGSPCPEKRELENGKQLAANDQQSTINCQLLAEAVAELPDHLGWGSAAQTDVLRGAARRRRGKQSTANNQRSTFNGQHSIASRIQSERSSLLPAPTVYEHAAQTAISGSVSLAPALGLAILRNKHASAARLWLLLRAIDKQGRGALPLDLARKLFTGEDSALRFCGQRQLRNLIAAGNELFWQVDGDQIWLRSAVRVAHCLGITRFRGQDVAIPVKALTGGIGKVRAHLFTAFHSGRDAAPVSRQTLARKSSIAPRTQRRYDRQSGVRKQANYANGPRVGSPEAEDLAWRHGPAAFTWRDRKRGRDEKNGRFLAWQLPNSYHGPHARLGRGRRKRQNKALADLLHKGTAGNDQSPTDDLSARYFADARTASRAYGRTDTAIYWPSLMPGVWHCLWQPYTADIQGRGNVERQNYA